MKDLLKRLKAINQDRKNDKHTMLLKDDLEKIIEIISGLVDLKSLPKMSEGYRKLPAQEPRVETGVIEFGDDWKGLFIRGDDSFHIYYILLELVDILIKNDLADTIHYSEFKYMLNLFDISNEKNSPNEQKSK